MVVQAPYLLFIGDVHDTLAAKTAQGVLEWRPERCLGQYRLRGCQVDLGIEDLSIGEAVNAGAKTFVIGATRDCATSLQSLKQPIDTAYRSTNCVIAIASSKPAKAHGDLVSGCLR
jgi:hypothetical protein